jgi:hypothetical protein
MRTPCCTLASATPSHLPPFHLQVTTLLGNVNTKAKEPQVDGRHVEELRAQVSAQGGAVKDAKTAAAADKGSAELQAASKAAVDTLLELKEQLKAAEEQ